MTTATKDIERIIAEQSVTIDIDSAKPYPKNPRVGDITAIQESLRTNGQFRPIVIQKSTDYILGGNHTWKAAKAEKWKKISATYVDVDDEQAKRIVLADNRTNDLATYDTAILADILKSLPSPVGTGYDDSATRALLHGMQDRDADLVRDVVRPPTRIDFDGAPEAEWDLHDHLKETQDQHDTVFGTAGNNAPGGYVEGGDTEKMRVAESIAAMQIQFEQWEDKKWPSSNYWGIPDLRSDMLVDTLPSPLDTWGGADATPDDGVTTWIWNTGVAASKGLPWDRSILSFFTYDTKFQSWFDQPAFQTARYLHNGGRMAIVPDTSFWNDDTRFHHLNAQFSAQWLARFMQECGVKIIPRFMWCDLESVKVGVMGIPRKPPIAAVCIQAIDKKEVKEQMTADGLRAFVKEIQPEALIVYGGGTAKQVTADAHLPKELTVVHVENYAGKRRGVVFDNATGKEAVEKAARKQQREAKASAKQDAQKAASVAAAGAGDA